MAKFLGFLLFLSLMGSTCYGQSFYKRHNKYKRSYITHSVTTPVTAKVKRKDPSSEFTGPKDGIAAYNARNSNTSKKNWKRANRIQKRNERNLAKYDAEKFRAENHVIGNRLSKNQKHTTLTGR
jgi:nitrate/TMAO reductase-like tetraheme cytochrome c subunit